MRQRLAVTSSVSCYIWMLASPVVPLICIFGLEFSIIAHPSLCQYQLINRPRWWQSTYILADTDPVDRVSRNRQTNPFSAVDTWGRLSVLMPTCQRAGGHNGEHNSDALCPALIQWSAAVYETTFYNRLAIDSVIMILIRATARRRRWTWYELQGSQGWLGYSIAGLRRTY